MSKDGTQLDGLFDSPTGLSLLVRNAQENAGGNETPDQLLLKELELFVGKLAWLIETQGVSKFVKIELIENFSDPEKLHTKFKEIERVKRSNSLVINS
jgi:hypothetical protein